MRVTRCYVGRCESRDSNPDGLPHWILSAPHSRASSVIKVGVKGPKTPATSPTGRNSLPIGLPRHGDLVVRSLTTDLGAWA
jgi:hypothetical protein